MGFNSGALVKQPNLTLILSINWLPSLFVCCLKQIRDLTLCINRLNTIKRKVMYRYRRKNIFRNHGPHLISFDIVSYQCFMEATNTCVCMENTFQELYTLDSFFKREFCHLIRRHFRVRIFDQFIEVIDNGRGRFDRARNRYFVFGQTWTIIFGDIRFVAAAMIGHSLQDTISAVAARQWLPLKEIVEISLKLAKCIW